MQGSVTRRQIIGAGAAALALPAIGLPIRANAPGSGPKATPSPPAPFRAIYDERFETGLAYAADAHARGWITRAIRGDVTHIWYHELAVRWKQGPAPIAGLTTEQSLFVLERLAWDVGMRVTAREPADPTTHPHLVAWQIGVPTKAGRSA